MTKLKGWKTHILNLLSLISVILAWDQLPTLIDPRYILLGQALANVCMRVVTDGPDALLPVLKQISQMMKPKGLT